ncbi:antibiotic biosynthesis regulator FhaB [Brooklawnia cerclae]|uniref:FHA domain-containing protein n=1 Tax=Brooklawnia cerclae TaxID=349934 RepID=A0ABX0SK65_9ACTN|nr:FHA domain-containing protein [Brooklawnia cerclae]NIH58760.1 hypothetical protein [Brooklawnia cerclae]
MSALLLAALKVAFLLLMWLFILFVTNVIRTDVFGRRVTPDELAAGGGIVHQAPPAPVPTAPPEPARIVITSGRAQGTWASLPAVGEEIVLGRAADCQLDVDDDYASSRHARVWHDREGFVVEDLLSTNGTYVNGQQISQPTRIGFGDVVRVGRSQLQLEA